MIQIEASDKAAKNIALALQTTHTGSAVLHTGTKNYAMLVTVMEGDFTMGGADTSFTIEDFVPKMLVFHNDTFNLDQYDPSCQRLTKTIECIQLWLL